MTGIDVILLPEELSEKDLRDCLIVVIDVLRASSTITTALAQGARKIIPVYLPDEAKKVAEKYCSDNVLLCGERDGKRISGFDLGNSPREYNREEIRNKIILLSTTNGIRTIELVKRSKEIIIGCFLNVKAVVEYCQSYSEKVLLVCSGDRGAVSLEDTVCAGMIKWLCEKDLKSGKHQHDDSLIACSMYRKYKKDLLHMMQISIWGKHLMQMGLKQDLIDCSQVNMYHHIPIIKGHSIECVGHLNDEDELLK